MGFTYTSSTPTCSEASTTQAVSSFVNRNPVCYLSTDASRNTIIKITNLATATSPTFYSLRLTGLTNGPSATQTAPGACFCTSYIGTVPQGFLASNAKETAPISQSLAFTPVYLYSGVSINNSPAQNNALGSLTISFSVSNEIPIAGGMSLDFPAQNTQINSQSGLTTVASSPVFPYSSSLLNPTGSYQISGTTLALSPSAVSSSVYTSVGTGQSYLAYIYLGNSAKIAAGAVVTVILNQCQMPPTLAPLTGFVITTTDSEFNLIEISPTLSVTNTAPGTDTSGQSAALITSNQGVLETGSSYSFTIYTAGTIPSGGYFKLKVPSVVGLPTDVTTMVMTCETFCTSVTTALDPNDVSGKTLLFQGVYPSQSAYVQAPGPIVFTVTGFTNPGSTTASYFQWSSFAVLSAVSYGIDVINSMYIQAVQGTCTISSVTATDGNTMIYGIATSWTVTMFCEHPINTDYGLVMTFPTDILVISTTNCQVGLQNSGYSCVADNTARTVTLFAFTNTIIAESVPFTFTFNSIRNPPVVGAPYTISFCTQAAAGGKIDLGSYTIPKTYFTYGTIWKYSVVPSSQGVGQYPVFYNFTVQPSGEIPVGSYFIVTLAPEVVVYNSRQIEFQCAYGTSGFTNSAINCQVQGQSISVFQGFQYKNTTQMLVGNAMVPPVIKFSIPQLQNPRTMTYTSAFGITIYNGSDVAIYTWNSSYYVSSNGVVTTEVSKGPVALMSQPAVPQAVVFTRASPQNGNLTSYNFTVTPTNYLIANDQVVITLPYPVFFTQQSQVYGISTNLMPNQTVSVSLDLTTITITLIFPIRVNRRLQSGSLYVITSGQAFQFQITNIRNPVSLTPTTSSITYAAYTNGSLVEQRLTGLTITNTQPGNFNVSQTSFLPQDFRPSFATNYTFILKPVNYEQNMRIVVTLPKEISLASNSVACIGLAGTDSQNLVCSLNITGKQITITNAVTFQKANPGTIIMLFSQLKNPSSNIVTSSLGVQTYTANGYLMDNLTSSLTINFFCQYPCQSCDSKVNSRCTSCYAGGSYAIFFNSTCLLQCPVSYINTTSNNCTSCITPCASCVKDPTTCTSCIAGHRLSGKKCFEIVYWPFPWAVLAIVSFMIVALSELLTKTTSKFKEAFMALLSIAENGAWITLTVFLYFRLGYLGYSFLGCTAAIVISIVINFVHLVIHQRLIIPNSLTSYKRVLNEDKFITYIILFISYTLSYRFSLLSVSYLFKMQRFSGDYSVLNWRHFHRMSLAYILLPFPIMMVSIAYFVYTDGIFSYAGFVSIEVVFISVIMFCIMALDAVSACRCKHHPKEKKAYQTSKVTSGADYESEDENPGKRLVKKRKDGGDEFGADESAQNQENDTLAKLKGTQVYDVNTSQIDEETKRQIAMLEELARQMREEKEQLRLEKDRIERERHLMVADKDQQLQKMQNYLTDYHNQTQALKGQVDSIQKSKAQLVNQVQQKLNEGVEHNKRILEEQMQQQRMLSKKAYRDIEGEMEDYDPVDEAEVEDEDSVIEEAAELPQPVAGQINYFRRLDGDEQYWLQQITPRAGGDSIMGQHDIDDEGQFMMISNKSAHYDAGTVPPSRHNREEYMMRSDASYSQINMVRLIEDAEIYRQQADAEMEVDSDRGGANSVQEYFQNEDAHYFEEDPRPQIDEKIEFITKEIAIFGTVDDKLSRNGSERQFLAQEQAAKGEAELPRSQYNGSTEQYLKNENAAFGNFANEGPIQREGTPVQYFDGDRPSLGRATDYERQQLDTQQQYLIRADPLRDELKSTLTKQTAQEYMNQIDSPAKGMVTYEPKDTNQQFMNGIEKPARGDLTRSSREVDINFISREPAARDLVSDLNMKEDNTQQFILERASQGRMSGIGKSDNEQAFVKQSAEFGKASEYDRKIAAAQNFRPVQQVLEDQSGHSESSEGIVDHNPFSQMKEDNVVNKQQARQQARQSIRQEISPPSARQPVKQEVKQRAPVAQPSANLINQNAKKKKTIIYSDKSESSIDDMMGDTPSNYNIPNGRLDGKSLGLKAILLHAQNHTGKDLEKQQTKQLGFAASSPRMPQSNNFGQVNRTNEVEERKFVNNLQQRQAAAGTLDTSHDGGWGNLNQPLGSKRTQVIGEESADERTSGQQKKKAVKTNKQFTEPAPGRSGVNGIAKSTNQTPKPGQQQPQLSKVKTNNFL